MRQASTLPISGNFLVVLFIPVSFVDMPHAANGQAGAARHVGRVTDAFPVASRGKDDPFIRAYRTLRQNLADGDFQPGDQIVVTEIARRLCISATPVREALARLVGERLVEDRRHYGYFVPLPSWFDLVELYDLCEMHVSAALGEVRRSRRRSAIPVAVPRDLAVRDDGARLAAILGLSQNARLLVAGQLTLEALGGAMRTEACLYPDSNGREILGAQVELGAWSLALRSLRREFSVRRSRAEPVSYAMAAAHRARNRGNIV